MPRPESSIWGNILTCIEVGLHIYAIQAERNSGLVLDADYAEDVLSEEALQLGHREGKHVYFDDVKSVAPAYELAQQGAITHPEWEEIGQEPERYAANGKYFVPEYFGSFEPPQSFPYAELTDLQQLDNGIYYANHDGQTALALHQVIGEQVLSDLALEQGTSHGEYLLYPLEQCAMPIYELSASHPAIAKQIISEDSLNHTLCADYPLYVAMHNQHTDEWGHIHDCAAPKSLFLQMQLDQAPVSEKVHQFPIASQAYEHASPPTPLFAQEPDEFFEPTGDLEL